MSGFERAALERDPELWLSRIHRDDVGRVLEEAMGSPPKPGSPGTVTRYRYRPGEGDDWRQFEARFFALEGAPDLTGAVVHDLTEAVEAARRAGVWEAERDRLLRSLLVSELAALITHEVNQPLTAILSWSEGAQMRFRRMTDLPEGVASLGRAFDEITAQGRRAGEIVNRLRRLIQRGEIEQVHVAVGASVERAVRAFRRAEPGARVEVAPTLAAVSDVRGESTHLEVAIVSALRHLHRARRADGHEAPYLCITVDERQAGWLRLHIPCAPGPDVIFRPLPSAAGATGDPADPSNPLGPPMLDLGVASAALEMVSGRLLSGEGSDGPYLCIELPRLSLSPTQTGA